MLTDQSTPQLGKVRQAMVCFAVAPMVVQTTHSAKALEGLAAKEVVFGSGAMGRDGEAT